MRAKMLFEKPPETAEYTCVWCDTTFPYGGGLLQCPTCGNDRRVDLIPTYMEDDRAQEVLIDQSDFHGG